ncbi:lysM domain receptor-like kinase 4 [Rhodamnia argentea]|uniref:LysM domain receptor-like kinase 4 n=1 Tax=Rhodamnia argentea TaxID=178133 RepID=A0A8B8N4T2_9MYRT|nr:lysM domain receptor-like kinase 4 [Rhodamnia argentea]
MIHLLVLIWAFFVTSQGQQYYDPSTCSSEETYPGSRYSCADPQENCGAFLLYRANWDYPTISNITKLFGADLDAVLSLNELGFPTENLRPGKEILIPIHCSCADQLFQKNVTYLVSGSTEFSEIACGVFGGLVKSITLVEDNYPFHGNFTKAGSELVVPLKCACPGNLSLSNGTVQSLTTYPIMEGDDINKVAQKFGVPASDIWAANHLDYRSTVYTNTTIVVPLTKEPSLTFTLPYSPPPSPGFLPTVPVEKATDSEQLRNLYIAGSVVGLSLVLVALIAYGLYLKALKRWKGQKLQSFKTRSSQFSYLSTLSSPRSPQMGRSSRTSCLSPDLLVGIKYSLNQYSIEELRKATRNFSEDTRIDRSVYKGLIDTVEVMIKGSNLKETHRVINVHSKINHINILTLLGICSDETSDDSQSYLIFEYLSNGSLRDCLSRQGNTLHWHRRTQIAFDVATGLHYLQHCIFPSYLHMNVNSRNIFIVSNWRAKIGNIAPTTTIASSKGNDRDTSISFNGGIAPEHMLNGLVSEKVDVFAFGVVLLELISGLEDIDGKQLKESIRFLAGGGNEGRCLEQLRGFMDPCLKDNYSLTEALCLAVLAKACVEDDPLHRPSMDDVMKVLARMV